MVTRVDAVEAKVMIDAGVVVIDVLPAAVYREEHLPGARSVPLDTFQPSDATHFDQH
jgi:rhodanese-related sulfurtransferase